MATNVEIIEKYGYGYDSIPVPEVLRLIEEREKQAVLNAEANCTRYDEGFNAGMKLEQRLHQLKEEEIRQDEREKLEKIIEEREKQAAISIFKQAEEKTKETMYICAEHYVVAIKVDTWNALKKQFKVD